MKEFKSRIANDLQVQGNLAAVTLICCIFTIFAFGLDIKSVMDENNANLPLFFHRRSYGFYVITIIFTLLSFAFNVIGIFWFIVVWFHNLILSCRQSDCCKYSCCIVFVHNTILFCSKKLDSSCCKKKWEVYIPMLFCIASALLTLSFHFQNILIAWSTDPFYASRIALFYGIIAFCYFISFKYAYIFPLKYNSYIFSLTIKPIINPLTAGCIYICTIARPPSPRDAYIHAQLTVFACPRTIPR